MIASGFCLRPVEVPTTSITSLLVAKTSEAQATFCALNTKIEISVRTPLRVSALFLPHLLPSFSKKESASSCSLFQTRNLHSRRHRSSDLIQKSSQHTTPTSATTANITSAPSPRQISGCSSKPMLRMIDVGGHKTELLEIRCERPVVRILVIPGNPGVVQFYDNFASTLFQELGGSASITVISHIAHTQLDWENGGLFSLAQQIEHKIQFLEGQMAPEDLATNLPGGSNREPADRRQTDDSESVPWILVGHSIGAHISLQLLRKFGPTKICHVAGLYPFLEVNTESTEQATLNRLAHIAPAGMFLAGVAGSLGRLPRRLQMSVMRRSAGSGFGDEALKVLCQSVLRYGLVRNFQYMGMTEFDTLVTAVDIPFLKAHSTRLNFLFGVGDHWGPLHLMDKLEREVEGLEVDVEREGYSHAFCCTAQGSAWVAKETAKTILARGLVVQS